MRNLIRKLFVAAMLLVSGAAMAAVEMGKDYKLLNPPLPTSTKKIEVLEFFFYGCSHCYDLHPQLSAWAKTMPRDVELVYVPTVFRDSWEPMARTYYALEALDQLRLAHDALYRAWNVNNEVLSDETRIQSFVATFGVDKSRFSGAYNSFSVQNKVTRAKQMIRSYAITGTPTLVVDGKYVLTGTRQEIVNGEPRLVGLSPAEKIRVLNDVIALARRDHPAIPAESKHTAKAK